MGITAEILLILVLVALNGVFAMSELALVSSRRSRLSAMERAGDKGAAAAADLAAEPERFLPTVQVGITLVGILAGAFGGARLATTLGRWFDSIGAAPYGEEIAFGLVVILITYLSLILGELVPKQLALRAPERIAARVARPLSTLSRVSGPIVWLLGRSSSLVLRLFGAHRPLDTQVTEEEVKALVEEGAQAGVLELEERDMIARVLRLADRPVRALMTPRTEIAWIDRSEPQAEIAARIKAAPHSRFVVGDGSIDNVVGVIQAKDILDRLLDGAGFTVTDVLRQATVLPDTITALDALERMRADPLGMALVMDEYGSFEGVVTASDVLEAIVGELAAADDLPEDAVHERADGSLLLDGLMPVDEGKSRLGLHQVPAEGSYHSLGGLILALLQRVPRTGDRIVYGGWRFEVVDMDGRRADKVLASREVTDG